VAALLPAALAGCGGPEPVQTAQRLPIYVSADGRGDYPTLAAAVREAPTGAKILLDPGTYRLAKPLDVFRSLSIVALGGRAIVRSKAPGRVMGFDGHGRLHLSGVTLQSVGGQADRPTDVLVARGGAVLLQQCRLEGAAAGYVVVRTSEGRRTVAAGGAGVRALSDARVSLEDCALTANGLAGVARERTAVVEASGTAVVGTPARPEVPLTLPRKRGPVFAGPVARFIDPQVRDLMDDLHVPGAVLAVVHDGRVVYLRGYGLSDVERRIAVDPRRTAFAIASVTKLFTATAVLQLWERGALELNRAVRTYVPGTPVGPTGDRQLTVADLLTHAGGFDELWVGIAAADAAVAPPLDEVVTSRAPTRVLPPGTISSYSNYAMTLAGAAAATAAATPYEALVRTQILGPLGMTATTFDRDLLQTGGAGDAAGVARSYTWDDGFRLLQQQVFASAPAGGLYATAADMARFMLAHLQEGTLGPARILEPATVELMHGRRFANGDTVPGYSYGFAEHFLENRRGIEHTGDFNGFSATVFLVPDEDLGIFVAANAGRGRLCQEVVERLMAQFYRDRDQLGRPQAPERLTAGLEQFVGAYRPVRHAHDTLDKWLEFSPDSDLIVTREPEGVLVIDDTRYAQIEPLAFRELYDDTWVDFARDTGGEVAFVFRGTLAFERLDWWETYVNQRRFIILFVGVFGLTALAWALAPLMSLAWHAPGWVRRLLAHQPFAARDPAPARVARAVAGTVAALDLAFLAVIAWTLTGRSVQYGVPSWLTATLVVPIVAAALTAGMAGMSVAAWSRRWWTITGRLLYCLLTLAAVFFVWFVAYWNLLGFRY
jgi:CubicO group peptidase (beta-lactamase class C family)